MAALAFLSRYPPIQGSEDDSAEASEVDAPALQQELEAIAPLVVEVAEMTGAATLNASTIFRISGAPTPWKFR